jgi:hypothetical protein
MNRRDDAASAPATKFNGRKFKRHQAHVAAQSCALFSSQSPNGAVDKHEQFFAMSVM